uniref:DDE Tnp4 domain-containing protein n=1 Tax=Sinocyclocheilus grahami TaxID=75366 RepID=A0A672NM66_SINGR
MDRQQLRRIIVAFLVTAVMLLHYFEQESKLRRDNILTMHLLRRRAIRRHFKRKRRALVLNGVDVLTRIRHQRATARAIRTIWAYPRTYEWWSYINNTWTDREWLQNFRMRRCTFLMLCDTLRPWLTRQNTTYRKPVPVEVRVAICIWRLATNLEYRSISHLFGVGLSTCCIITQEVVTAINVIMKPQYIKTPSLAEFRMIVQGFRDKWRFPQVAGCIDGTHLNTLYISAFLCVLESCSAMCSWPGSVHDARVLRNSKVYDLAERGQLFPPDPQNIRGTPVPVMILGDPAYPLRSWLMKGYTDTGNLTDDQHFFNKRLSRARMTVECAFEISLIPTVISTCCVLHNICEKHNSMEEDIHTHAPSTHQEVSEVETADISPLRVRQALTAYFSGTICNTMLNSVK